MFIYTFTYYITFTKCFWTMAGYYFIHFSLTWNSSCWYSIFSYLITWFLKKYIYIYRSYYFASMRQHRMFPWRFGLNICQAVSFSRHSPNKLKVYFSHQQQQKTKVFNVQTGITDNLDLKWICNNACAETLH